MVTSPAQKVPKKCLCLSIALTCRCQANNISVLKYFEVFHVFDILQSLGTLFKLFLEKRNGAAVLLTNVHYPAAIQTPAVFNVQRPHIPNLQQNINRKRKKKLNTLYLERDSSLICFSNGFYVKGICDMAVPSVTFKVIHVNHYFLSLPAHCYVSY